MLLVAGTLVCDTCGYRAPADIGISIDGSLAFSGAVPVGGYGTWYLTDKEQQCEACTVNPSLSLDPQNTGGK